MRALAVIKSFFVGMFSNKECINNYRRPWYFALIYIVILLGLVWIPPYYTFTSTKGSQAIGTTSGVDTALVQLVSNTEYGFQDSSISDDHYFVPSETFKELATYNLETYTGGISIKTKQQDKEVQIMKVFYYDADPLTNEGREGYQNLSESIFKASDGNNGTTDIAKYSYMIISPTTIQISLYPVSDLTKDSQYVANFSGYFDVVKTGTFKNIILKDDVNITDATIFANWQTFLNDCYYPIQKNTFMVSIISYEIGVFVISFMIGVLFFISSRGKKSLYKDMSFWGATKVGYMFTFTPGIIAFIVSFFLPSAMIVGFIFLLACVARYFFAAKKMKDIDNDDNKPLYQART